MQDHIIRDTLNDRIIKDQNEIQTSAIKGLSQVSAERKAQMQTFRPITLTKSRKNSSVQASIDRVKKSVQSKLR